MLIKSVVLLLVAVAVQSASVSRNIPVEVRYERLEHDFTSNLAEKVQLSENDLQENQVRLANLENAAEEPIQPEKPAADHSNLIKNLDEKVQLSQEELLQSTKHLPLQQNSQDEVVSQDNVLAEVAATTPEAPNQLTLIEKAQEIFQLGLQYMKNNFVPKDHEQAPTKEMWEKLEEHVKEYFQDEKNKLSTRQSSGTDQQNIFQNIVYGFQNLTNNFIQQLPGQRPANGTSSDETSTQSSNPFQGFVSYFTGGVQTIVQNIQNIGQNASGQQTTGNSTVLGDSTTQEQGPQNNFGNFVSNIQQLFGQGTTSANSTPTDSSSQQGFFAGAVNQFNNAINNFNNIIPTSQQPPAAQGDEVSATTSSSLGPVQQVFNQFGDIGTAINNLIQGGQNKPQGSEDESTSQAPNQNFIQSIGQNIGNAFQNIQNQFRPPSLTGSTDKPAEGSNPIVGQITNIGSQIQQAAGQSPIQSLIPGSSSSSSSSETSTDSSQKKKDDEAEKIQEEKKEPMIAIE